MRPLILVACCGMKLDRPAAARDLYVSPLFKKSKAWAEARGDWFILSALYGVVDPARVIAPYNVTLTTMPANKRAEWNARVAAELAPYAGREIHVLAGVAYLGWMGPPFSRVSLPLAGLGIGKRLAWLTRENAALEG